MTDGRTDRDWTTANATLTHSVVRQKTLQPP